MLIAGTAQALSGQWGMGDTPWGWHIWWGAWGMGMLLFMLLFWALVIAGIVALVRWAFGWSGFGGRAMRGGRALDILKERYARGELTREQFEAMRRDIES
jgi:putative membrane protein